MIPKLSRFLFLEKLFANSFASSAAEDNTSSPLKRGIIDLPFLRTLLVIHLFWFISMSKFGSFKNHFLMITIAGLNSTLDADLSVGTDRRSNFYA